MVAGEAIVYGPVRPDIFGQVSLRYYISLCYILEFIILCYKIIIHGKYFMLHVVLVGDMNAKVGNE